MNTERPDNDDADGSVEERGAGGSTEEQGAAETKSAAETTGASETKGASEGQDVPEERDVPEEPAAASAEAFGGEESSDAVDSGTDVADSVEAGAEDAGAEAARPGAAGTVEAGPGDAGDDHAGDDDAGAEAARPGAASAVEARPGDAGDDETGPDEDEAAAKSPAAAPSPVPDVSSDADPEAEIPRDQRDHDVEESGGGVRSSRHRSPAVVVSVAAAVLLVGGGGAYFATTTADGSAGSGGGTTSRASGDGTPPPLALDGYSKSSGTSGIAPGEPNPYGVTYRAAGTLPDGPGSAPVYRAQGQVTEAEVAELARALGVDGKPVAAGQAWTVGAKDSMGPSLQVNRQAPGTWTFHRYAPGTDDCQSATVCAKTPADPGGDPVSEAVAKKAAAPVLKAAGQDDTKLDASRTLGAQRIVNAEPVIGDLPTYGWTTGVTVDAQGKVLSGNGRLKAPVKSDTYPVLSAKETLALLNAAPGTDHRMGIGGCASPVPQKDRLEAPCGSSTATEAKETLTVEKAVFGLAPHTVAGRQTLVPSWLFDVRTPGAQDDVTVTYPAVDPEYVISPTPSARPSGPGDEPTAAPTPRDVHVDGYTAEGRELTVSFTGGVCADYKATASESGNKVTVKVTETRWPDKVCIMIAKEFEKTVRLGEPLGDRAVVGSDGKGIPLQKAGARLPETSGAR